MNQELKRFLKSLTPEELFCTNFVGANFDDMSMEYIVMTVRGLVDEVLSYKNMIDNNFQSANGEKVLIPKSREAQESVLKNYDDKLSGLKKLFTNDTLYKIISEYMEEKRKAGIRKS